MAAPSTQYETLYGVSLLDDIHNYFPAILYDSSRFRTTQDLLHYIQVCTRNRFDLFSFGQRAYLSNHLPPALERSSPSSQVQTDLSGATVTRPTSSPQTPQAPRRRHRPQSESSPISFSRSLEAMVNQITDLQPNHSHSRVINITEDDLGLDEGASSLLNLVNLLGGFAPIVPVTSYRTQGNIFDDVVVAPTQEQIDTATTRTFPTADTPCSICQDSIANNQMARQLNHCKHMFHISCIDEWFARDVHCPVCRHDIRDIEAPQDTADTSHP